jgi:hypothetical protein
VTDRGHGREDLLTLEPLTEAVREGVEAAGWELSGVQKTTSHRFEGRWEGESTRSAYLFFHRPLRWTATSVDVYLDETSRGLRGNLALVSDLRPLPDLPPVPRVLAGLGAVAERHLPAGYRTPVVLRLRLAQGSKEPSTAALETRIKLHLPRAALEAGAGAVAALSSTTVSAFEGILADPESAELLDTE